MKKDNNPNEFYNQNLRNENDVQKIQQRMASSQAININKPHNTYEEEWKDNDNVSESEDVNKSETLSKASQQKIGLKKIASSLIGGPASGEISGAEEIVLAPIRRMIIMISVVFVALTTVILFAGSVLITHSEKNREYTKSTVKQYSNISNDNDNYRIAKKRLNKDLTDFDIDTDKPSDFFEYNLSDDLITYLSNNGYCDKSDCESSDAYAFYKKLIIHVLENEKEGKSIDVGLLYETMAYYRADDELFQGSTSSDKELKWWQVILNLFRKKTDEMDTLTEKMFNSDQIDLNQYAAYLLYGDRNASGFDGYLDIGNATNMAEAFVKTALAQVGISGRPNKFTGGRSEPWCADFVSWVVANTTFEGKKLSSVVKFSSAAVSDWVNFFQNNRNLKFYYNDNCSRFKGKNGSGKYEPKMGDIIFFDWQQAWGGTFPFPFLEQSHIGIVKFSKSGKVYTVEGNSSDSVREKEYPLNSCQIAGYGSWY